MDESKKKYKNPKLYKLAIQEKCTQTYKHFVNLIFMQVYSEITRLKNEKYEFLKKKIIKNKNVKQCS